MKTQAIHSEILDLEKISKNFLIELAKQKILKSKDFSYSDTEKKIFLNFWNDYADFFKRFQKAIKKSHYRKMFFFVNYNKFVMRRYLIISYFNLLSEILNIF